MPAFFENELTSIAFCWRLERRDGICLGFTTHDRDLVIGGLVYRSAPGMLPSAISASDGFDPASLDVTGALTSDAISGEDLAAGRWDGASLRVFMVDWRQPEGEQVQLARGELGDVGFSGSGFEAELKGPTALLERAVVEQTSPECRALLGGKRCRVDMAGRVWITRIAVVLGDDVIELVDPGAPGTLAYGGLRWIGGANSGLDRAILAVDGARIILREPPSLPAAAGDLVRISEGCDKSLATCSGRFGNVENFRGEPHLPGIDLLTRYPGA